MKEDEIMQSFYLYAMIDDGLKPYVENESETVCISPKILFK